MTKLKYILSRRGISGKEFADICGISCSTIYKYMSGARSLSEKTARKLAPFLGIDAEDIMGEV